MKRKDLKKLALLGLTSGAVLSQSLQASSNLTTHQANVSALLALNASKTTSKDKTATDVSQKNANTTEIDPNEGNLGYHLMSEDELMLELSADGQRMYTALDSNNKKLALEVASSRCANSNSCKQLNACKTDKNDCAGQAACKGLGKCGIADKNLAVRLVYNKMMKKRTATNGGA
jgi:hypothetical protein